MQSEIDDSIEVNVYCMNEICSYFKKEMNYESVKQEPSALRISSVCVGCRQKTEIRVKV